MVDLSVLGALDGLLWLRKGEAVAEKFDCNQSTISRNAKKCLAEFGLRAKRIDGEWQLKGDLSLIAMERTVHQHARWRGHRPLRLEAQHRSGPLFCDPAPPGWILGNFDYLEYKRPIQLMRERVVDAWLASYPDCPDADDPEIACFRLSRVPLYLLVAEGHPLLALGDRVTMADVANYPSLALPDGAFPKFQAQAEAIGLWNTPTKLTRFRQERWYGTMEAEALVVAYATPLTVGFFETKLKQLPLVVPIEVGDALLVRREFAATPQTLALKDLLLGRIRQLAATRSDITLLA